MPSEVYAPSADAAFEEALRLVLNVKYFLESEEFLGLVLGSPECVAKVYENHYARPFDALAVEYFKNSLQTGVRSSYRSDRLAIDMSPGSPELETVHRVYAKDDLRKITEFYEKLIRSELSFDDLEFLRLEIPQRLNLLAKGQTDLLETLPNRLERITLNFEGSMKKHLSIIDRLENESELRSHSLSKALEANTAATRMLPSEIAKAIRSEMRKERRARKRAKKRKPLSRLQRLMREKE